MLGWDPWNSACNPKCQPSVALFVRARPSIAETDWFQVTGWNTGGGACFQYYGLNRLKCVHESFFKIHQNSCRTAIWNFFFNSYQQSFMFFRVYLVAERICMAGCIRYLVCGWWKAERNFRGKVWTFHQQAIGFELILTLLAAYVGQKS